MGGQVYRGDKSSSFYGVYVFGDHQSKRIWGLTQDHGSLEAIRHLATAPQAITAFADDEEGGLYVVGYQGMIYQLDFAGTTFDKPDGDSPAHSALAPDAGRSTGITKER